MYSTDPWSCEAAEEWATGRVTRKTQATVAGSTKLCYVEVRTNAIQTGLGYGVGVALIGVDFANRARWLGTSVPMPASSSPTPLVGTGGPTEPNMRVDKDAMTAALVDVRDHYRAIVDDETRKSCLGNPLTAAREKAGAPGSPPTWEPGWTDLRAHYYCQLPYAFRSCFATAAVLRGTPPDVAFKTCVAQEPWLATRTVPGTSVTHPQVFKYVGSTVQGARDFNLAEENDVINDFYAAVREARPRRLLDPKDGWVPDQPRYEVVKDEQFCTQKYGTQRTGAQAGRPGRPTAC
jgi:hypothetical protein